MVRADCLEPKYGGRGVGTDTPASSVPDDITRGHKTWISHVLLSGRVYDA